MQISVNNIHAKFLLLLSSWNSFFLPTCMNQNWGIFHEVWDSPDQIWRRETSPGSKLWQHHPLLPQNSGFCTRRRLVKMLLARGKLRTRSPCRFVYCRTRSNCVLPVKSQTSVHHRHRQITYIYIHT